MQFLYIFYNILFHPSQEFRVVSMGPVPKDVLLAYGSIIILVVSAMGVVFSPLNDTADGLVFKMILSAVGGLLFWLLTGLIFSTTAYVFGDRGRPQTFLILSAFATAPWVLLPILMLFKHVLGGFGNFIAITGSLGLWLWSAVLFLMAIKYTYNMSLDRVLLITAIPGMMSFLWFSWVWGFFFNLFQFLS